MYKKIGNIVYGMPFKDGSYGIKVVKDKVRIFLNEPTLRYRVVTPGQKIKAVL